MVNCPFKALKLLMQEMFNHSSPSFFFLTFNSWHRSDDAEQVCDVVNYSTV